MDVASAALRQQAPRGKPTIGQQHIPRSGKLWRPRRDNGNEGRNHADFLENLRVKRTAAAPRAGADFAAITVRRLAGNPIIRPEMLPGRDGSNINGPSLIRAPEWLPDPLGRCGRVFQHGGRWYAMAKGGLLFRAR